MFALIRSDHFFFSLFSCLFSFRLSLAFFCCSLLRLSFFPESLISVSPLSSCIQRSSDERRGNLARRSIRPCLSFKPARRTRGQGAASASIRVLCAHPYRDYPTSSREM